MLKYLVVLLLVCSISRAEFEYKTFPELIRGADRHEDSEPERLAHISILKNVLRGGKGKLTDSNKTLLEGTINRLELVGQPLELCGQDLSGNDLCLCSEEYQNKIVIIDFWASWCGPCVSEIQKIKPIYEKYKDNVEILGVNMDQDVSSAVTAKIRLGANWKHFKLTDPTREIIEKYAITSIPRVLLIGPDGKVVRLDVHSTELEDEIRELLGLPKRIYYYKSSWRMR